MLLPCSWRREAEKRPAEGEKTGCHGKTPSQRQLLRRLALIKPKARPMKKTGCHGKTPSRRQHPGFVTRSKPKARPMKKSSQIGYNFDAKTH